MRNQILIINLFFILVITISGEKHLENITKNYNMFFIK